jgi:hypothetical protein
VGDSVDLNPDAMHRLRVSQAHANP